MIFNYRIASIVFQTIFLFLINFFSFCQVNVVSANKLNFEDSLIAAKLNALSVELRHSNIDSSILCARQAMHNAKKADINYEYGNALNYLGIALYYLGENDSAMTYNENARQIFIELGDSIRFADVSVNIGNIWSQTGHKTLALEDYLIALKIYTTNNHLKGQVRSYNNIGNTYSEQGNYSEALTYYYKSLMIAQEQNNLQELGHINSNIGIIYFLLQEYNSAKIHYLKAYNLYSKINNQHYISSTLDNLGSVYTFLGKNDSSEIFYKKGLKMAEELGYDPMISSIKNNLGELYLSKNEFQKSYGYFNTALVLYEKINHEEGITNTLIGLGKVLNRTTKYYEAIPKLEEAYLKSLHLNAFELVKFAAEELSIAYENIEKPEEALKYYKVFKQMGDSLLNTNNLRKLTSAQMRYEFDLEQKKSELLNLQKEMQHKVELRKIQVRKTIIVLLLAGLTIITTLLFLYLSSKQKAKISSLKIDVNKNMQRLLGQQMNPHFIFNTLKSIQNFILNNNSLQSNIYLTKFSRLIRKILENSQNEFISIKDEMEALELYMQLENLRMGNKFDFEIHIDTEIDPIDTKVPSLLFQPFVENSIWHGISPLEEQGLIKVSLIQEKQKLLVEIEDNGIGRNNIQMKNNIKHKSLGSTITQKRINLINSAYRMKISPQISDIETNGKINGTRVSFSLPIVYS